MRQPDPLMHSAIFRPETREEIEANAVRPYEALCTELLRDITVLACGEQGAMQISKAYAQALEDELRKRK